MKNSQLAPSILLVDDEESITSSIESVISTIFENAQIHIARNGKQGLNLYTTVHPNLVIVDYQMPEMNGLEFIKAAKSINDEVPIIVLTAHGDKNVSIQFLKEGAYRYIDKPFDIEEFQYLIEEGIKQYHLIKENKKLQNILTISDGFSEIIGKSEKMTHLFEQISQVASTDATVLIQGESGTGKELIAKAIHEKSEFKNGPFIPFNCAALPETLIESELFGYEKGAFTGAEKTKLGRFELAQNGTIFIDEIGEIDPNTQVKLLRILQEKQFQRIGGTHTIATNCRVITATNKSLSHLTESGEFRNDLFYRLSVFPIEVPPLREREDDIGILANYFLDKFKKKYNKTIEGFAKEALKVMNHYHWHGNVRELENVISRATIICNTPSIQIMHLGINAEEQIDANPVITQSFNAAIQEKWTEEKVTKAYAKEAYKACKENKNETAKFLNLNYRTLISRLSD